MDPAAAAQVAAAWPTDLIVSPLGRTVLTGSRLMQAAPPEHPVPHAYRIYLGDIHSRRPSWDPLAALYAIAGTRDPLRPSQHAKPG